MRARILFLLWVAGVVAVPAVVLAQGDASDPLVPFLQGLADSTDAYFGTRATVFDTTGIDSLIRLKETRKPGREGSRTNRAGALHLTPVAGFHRATGSVLGARALLTLPGRASLGTEQTYGFANHEGRYRVALSRPLLARDRRRTDLRIDLSYARETVPFASEHATPLVSAIGALLNGRNGQDVYERRGGMVSMTWSQEGRFATMGWRFARDQSMPRATRFSLWGDRARVPEVAAARAGSYREGFARLATTRSGWPALGLDGRYASRERWRVRGATAQRVVLPGFEAHVQAEAGMAAEAGPSQDRFELGGPLAVPSLGFGDAAGNRLLLGKLELVHGMDLVRALHLSPLRFIPLHPALFVQEGSAWIARDGNLRRPPDGEWRGAAGIALVHMPGFPSPSTCVRLSMAWPLGPESGTPRFSVSVAEWFEVVNRAASADGP